MYGSLNRVLCTSRHGEIARFLTILAVTKRSKNLIGDNNHEIKNLTKLKKYLFEKKELVASLKNHTRVQKGPTDTP